VLFGNLVFVALFEELLAVGLVVEELELMVAAEEFAVELARDYLLSAWVLFVNLAFVALFEELLAVGLAVGLAVEEMELKVAAEEFAVEPEQARDYLLFVELE
jgi:hypothetical protein